MFSLILYEINFYLDFASLSFLQLLSKILNFYQKKRFSFIYENNKIRNYEKDYHLTLW